MPTSVMSSGTNQAGGLKNCVPQHNCPVVDLGCIELAICVPAMRSRSLTAPVINHLLS